MAQCPWPECDKSLPGEDEPACNFCLLRPPPQESELEKSEEENTQVSEEGDAANFDLTYLNKSFREKYGEGKTKGDIKKDLEDLSFKFDSSPKEREEMMQLKSRNVRNRTLVFFSDLILSFDENGIAEFPESELERIRAIQKYRPGRFELVEEENEPQVSESLYERLEKARNALIELESQEEEQKKELKKKTSSKKKASKKKSTKKKSTARKKTGSKKGSTKKVSNKGSSN
jgi:hypothetical protein